MNKKQIDLLRDYFYLTQEIRPKLLALKEKEYNSEDLPLSKEMNIGVELEFQNILCEHMEQEIIRKGLLKDIFLPKPEWMNEYFDEYYDKQDNTKWDAVPDGSLDYGAEFRSPIINSSKKYMEQLEYVEDIFNTMGLEVGDDCAFHVHIGVDYLDKDVQAWQNFFNIWNETEELIYKMSNDVGDVIREDAGYYAKKRADTLREIFPNGEINITNEEELDNVIEQYNEGTREKYIIDGSAESMEEDSDLYEIADLFGRRYSRFKFKKL